jgi:putative transcriptional regulator
MINATPETVYHAPMFHIALESLLKQKGKSAYWLAQQTGLHNSVLSKYKNNEVKAPRLDVLDKICGALECEIGELLVRIPDKKNRK